MEPMRVEVRRGGVVEAVHEVHAVAVSNGGVVAERGDSNLVTFIRSSAKPIQALPLARARDDLDDRDLAIASASHLADEAQLAAVRALLAKAPADEDELECGAVGDPPRRINHNCSGKHAGMLALCRARGWASAGYRLPEHPVQRAMLAEVAAASGLREDEIPTAVDGCGVVTFALSLERIALAFARLETLNAGATVASAMRAYPTLIRGELSADCRLMSRAAGWTAKGGAEGLMCAAGPDGLGLALKVLDGDARAVAPALGAFLDELGHPVEGLGAAALENSRGERVGEVAVAATRTVIL